MELPRIDPVADPVALQNWISDYLTPRSLGGGGARAHQFTINGLTYPFVRHYNFAAVPDPPDKRRYDMYSGLHLPLPGDLLFFFQADPQAPGGGISARRGIRGIYRVTGRPYRAPGPITDTVSDIGYQILHQCPNPACNTPHATFAPTCPLCGSEYPSSAVIVNGKAAPMKVLSSCLPIEPVFAFERPVSDERAYADFSDPGIIWMGRHDNAMGAGKGSSIRHLLPEEAIKLARLLATEPDQSVGEPALHLQPQGDSLSHATGTSITDLPVADGSVAREDELYFLITQQIFAPGSPMQVALTPHLPHGVTWDHLEYAASTFPWGYTAGAADYVLLFRNASGRCAIVILECKTGRVNDEAILQVLLYAERVLQIAFFSAPIDYFPRGNVDIVTVVIASGAKRPRVSDPRVALPLPFSIQRSYLNGPLVTARVSTPLFLVYSFPRRANQANCPMADFRFAQLDPSSTRTIAWSPRTGQVGTAVEMAWILKHEWRDART